MCQRFQKLLFLNALLGSFRKICLSQVLEVFKPKCSRTQVSRAALMFTIAIRISQQKYNVAIWYVFIFQAFKQLLSRCLNLEIECCLMDNSAFNVRLSYCQDAFFCRIIFLWQEKYKSTLGLRSLSCFLNTTPLEISTSKVEGILSSVFCLEKNDKHEPWSQMLLPTAYY